jgi:uncharacterized damage-inducible protein DinB
VSERTVAVESDQTTLKEGFMRRLVTFSVLLAVLALGAGLAQAQDQTPPTPQERLARSWNSVHKKLIDMAEDFPEDKYDYKAHPDVRSFGEELMHVATVCALIAERAQNPEVKFGDVAKNFQYTSKADTVAKLKKSVEDVSAVVEGEDNLRLIFALEHAGEHYGKLVVYYRVNGLVPPATRAAQERRRQQQEQN